MIRGRGRSPHLLLSTITYLTRVIDAARKVVSCERGTLEGLLLAGELVLRALLDGAVVWSRGEYSDVWSGGRAAGASGRSIAGMAVGTGGILISAAPLLGHVELQAGSLLRSFR